MKFAHLLVSLLFLASSHAQTITTVAGNGTYGYSGDGGPAITAMVGDMYYTYPAFDNAGNMYIAQNGNNIIRKIDVSGTISTIAGTNGVMGYTGDGGLAVNALLYHPTSIAIDNNNNIFFADRNGDVIRKIDPTGIITTVSGFTSINCGAGDGGPLAQAEFGDISALSFDQFNNLYISDYGCNTIRKVNGAGIITTIAGNGTLGFSGDGGPATQAQLAYPCKIAIDNAGNLYIPDAQNHRIRKVSTSGIITTFAGTGIQGYSGDGGPALSAEFAFPGSIVIDNLGNFYVGDYNQVIRKIDGAGIVTTYGGNGTYGYSGDGGPAILASIALTEGRISIYNNDLYFANYTQGGPGNTIRKISNCQQPASIDLQPTNATLCNSGNTSFSIVATNATNYQWQINSGSGWTNITNTSIFSGANLNTLMITGVTTAMNNAQFRCILSTNCGPLFSSIAILTVNSPQTPDISITTPSTTICDGSTTTFSSSIQNGGSTPFYQWKKNGTIVGTNSDTYSDNSIATGDIIVCELISNAACITGNTVISNPLVFTVSVPVTPNVSISPSTTTICSGTNVTFFASTLNGGLSPSFSWFKNNIDQSINSPTFTDNSLNNGDIITCTLVSSLSCLTSTTTSSPPVTMTVIPLVTPSISIISSENAICQNETVTFSATSLHGGNSPIYQWMKNGIAFGNNSYTITDNTLVTGDIITCTMTSNSQCVTNSQATSNTLIIPIYTNPVVLLDKTNTLCEGTTRILDAGAHASYLWNTGSTSRSILINDIGQYTVTVTDINGCIASDFTTVSTILASPTQFLPEDTSLCSYGTLLLKANPGFQTYHWSNGTSNPLLTVTQPGQYWLEVTNNNGCKGKDSISIKPKECLKGFFMPTAFTPNNDGKNDVIKPILLGIVKQYRFTIYNRWGQVIFQTTDVSIGWDGFFKGVNQDTNVFVWVCNYQFENESPKNEKGTLVLIR